MRTTSVIQRLLLLASVPLLASVISLGMQTRQSYVDYRNSEQTLQLMDLSVSAGKLIHSLQVERGSTAGFLQSKGQKFADVLPGVRATADERLAAFTQEIGRTDVSALSSLAKAIITVKGRLDELASIRQKADQQALTVADEVAYYTQTIASLIGAMSVGVEFNQDTVVSQKMIAYLSFVRAKENAGQERALVTAAFTANKLDPEQFRTILSKIHYQNAYLNDFTGIAGVEEKNALEAVLGANAAKEVARMRAVLADKSVEGEFGVDPAVWFATITSKMDSLHEAEAFISGRIKDEANSRMQSSRTMFFSVLVLGTLALVITLVVSLGVARSIAFPLREMVAFAEHSIAERDFSGEVPEHGATEVARTGAVFNNLISKFRTIILDTRESSNQITGAAHALALSSQRVGDGSLVQSDAASSVATAVEQASVSVSETASNAHAAAAVVARARQDSEEALVVMRDMMSNMSEVARLIHDSGLKVEALNGSSQKIGSIVQVIKDIADQTNLLALNAAIEAARAGEQGRGFAVVADEVRKLAERTTLSTSEIASLITSIQNGISSTMAAMQLANAQSDASLKLVDRSEHAVQQIDRGSREVAENVQNISSALSEQDSAIRQIAVNVEQIAQMTESNNDAAADNSRTAVQLDSLSLQLREAVSVFKL